MESPDQMEDVFLQDSLCPTIAEHAAQCNSLFHTYIALPELVPDPTVMDDQMARFTLWASNMDVFGPLNVSLDYRLRFSPTIVDIIHDLLDVICETLTSLKPVNDPPQQMQSRKRRRMTDCDNSEPATRANEDASDSDSVVDQEEENISKIAYTIGGTVTRLFRLSNAIRRSAKANRAQKIDKYRDDPEANKSIAELRLYTDCYIRFRYPMAPEALRSALVEANALRLRRLYYQRSHRRRVDLSIQSPRTTAPVVQLPKMKENTPTLRFAPSVVVKPVTVDRASEPAARPPAAVTNATTARHTAIGSQYAKSTTEVPRAKSVLVNNKLSFPPIPPTPQCPYCGVIIEFKNKSKSALWHDHVIRDLEPFICVFPQCLNTGEHETSPPTFETSRAWISHMQNAHGHVWECRAPSHGPVIFHREIQYLEHSVREHGVPEEHTRALSNAAQRPALDKMLECPFGDDFQPPENSESSTVFASEALQTHIAAHIKEVGLLTLQKLPSDDDEEAETVESDQLGDDDGSGFARRGSMYSILDDEALDFHDDDEAPKSDLERDEEDISPSVTRLDLEEKDSSGMTELHHAVEAEVLSLVESLIQNGANLGARDNEGRTALHYASMRQSRDTRMISVLLNAGGNAIINLRDINGQSALHYAVESNNIESVHVFLKHDVDTLITDYWGFSPLLWAVVSSSTDIVKELLSHGADPNSASTDGKTALAWAAGQIWTQTASVLLDHGANILETRNARMVPLNEAAASGCASMVQLLLVRGGDPNYRDRDGWSPVHWAAEEGHLDLVLLLLDRGANYDAVSSYGTSPLHCAANGGHDDIVRLLLSRGADPCQSTCHGWTPLHHAAYMGQSRVAQRLLQDERVQSSASQQDNHGWSVLHLAVQSRDPSTVETLVASSTIAPALTLFDDGGLTAREWLDLSPTSHSYKAISNLAFDKSRCCRAATWLRHAATTGNIPLIRLLIKKGHQVNSMDSGSRTALYYAVKKRALPVLDLLLSNGADPNILPTGRESWEEITSDQNVLLQLGRAGYRKRRRNAAVESRLKHLLDAQGQDSGPPQSVSFPPDEYMPFVMPKYGTSDPVVSTPASTYASASTMPKSALPLPIQQKYDNKRKARSVRSAATSFWKRMTG